MAFFESTAKLYVHLHPSCLEDPTAALEQELNSKLLQYDEKLQGVVLSYDQIKVEDEQARVRIFADSHYINVHISTRLLLFRPQAGCKLVGEVNYTNSSAVGLLVHGIFNASISDEHIPDEWEFYEDQDADTSYWAAGETRMEIGSLVEFEVVDFRTQDDILSIQACILDSAKYGVVGKAAVPLAERHRLDASLKADASGAAPTPSASKKRVAEASPSPATGNGHGKKKKKVAEVEEKEGEAEEEGEKKDKKKKSKKDKKAKKDK